MSGLLAGLLLDAPAGSVDIFERVESELSGRGAGIVAQPDLIETLCRLDIDPTDLGVAITTRKLLDPRRPAGGRVRLPAGSDRVGARLSGAAGRIWPQRYHRGHGVHSFEQTRDRVVAS